jgi:hypothetical protein
MIGHAWGRPGAVGETNTCHGLDRCNERPQAKELIMSDKRSNTKSLADLRHRALSRWDHEGGSKHDGPQEGEAARGALAEIPALTNSELVQLRIRVISLENVIIALLAHASDEQLKIVRTMADYIAPRPGFTHHPLTVRASAHMIDLVHRAAHFGPTQA